MVLPSVRGPLVFYVYTHKNFLGYFRGLKKNLKNWQEDQLLDPLIKDF
jgi:hypothetical protein